jgi:hypothetical protein
MALTGTLGGLDGHSWCSWMHGMAGDTVWLTELGFTGGLRAARWLDTLMSRDSE